MGIYFLGGLQMASAKSIDIHTSKINSLWDNRVNLKNTDIAQQYPYQRCFENASKKYQIPVEILIALARGESNFNASVKSKSNAYGVMQILWPSTAKHLGINSLSELLKPCVNIMAGAKYLKELLTRYNDNLHLAMAAYNYGPGRIKKFMHKSGMPNGAIWYSHYIYEHYLSIVDRQHNMPKSQIYKPNNQIVLLKFNQAYRAKGFVDYLKQQNKYLKVEWFKTPLSSYHIVLRYENKKDLIKSKKILLKQGFKV
jgi:hypothetical protein